MGITANKGEWSELYVLFKILAEKKIYAGDGELNKLDAFYPVLKVLRDELERHLEYTIDKEIVIITEDGNEVSRIDTASFLEQSKILFSSIQSGDVGSGAFEIPFIDAFLNKIHCRKIKAKSQDKADINIVIHDYHTGMTPNLGFSIKSEAGAAPTLLNASNATTFVFEIDSPTFTDDMMDEVNAVKGNRKIQDRINLIIQKGANLKFAKTESSVFENNLRMIDSCMPRLVSWMLADCYQNRDMNIGRAVERISEVNPLKYDFSDGHDFYGYKVKTLMVCIALGMLPATPWNGRYDATGGYIVVKNDGDVVCFHLYDRNLLEDYLFYNTKFETPSSSRYNMGEVYKKEGKYYFNLVMQIRFV